MLEQAAATSLAASWSVAIALNVLEVVAQDASNRLFNQNGFRRHAGFRFRRKFSRFVILGREERASAEQGAVYPIGE